MNDRELLEMAAKAAGLVGYEYCRTDQGGYECMAFDEGGSKSDYWNPLTDDGDALRLAVRLELYIAPSVFDIDVFPESGHGCATETWENPDRYAVTRRAIVRAAAAIGGAKG